MSRRLLVLWAAAALGCGSVASKHVDGGSGGSSGGGGAAGTTDAGQPDTGPTASCNPTSPFGTPTLVPGLNSTSREDGLSFTADLTIAFFSSFRGGTGLVDHIYTAARSAPDQTFGTPTLVTSVMGTSGVDFAPRISPDGLRLYLASSRSGASHIYLATRASLVTDFTAPAMVAVVNSAAADYDEYVTTDEQTMVFASTRTGGLGAADLYISQRTAGGFGAPMPLTEVSSTTSEFLPALSDDRLTIYFGSDRTNAAAKGGTEIWIARRTTATGAFGAPQLVAELNSALDDFPVWLSPDACTLYFSSGPTAAMDFFVATRGH
jgi:Tol biopolymer transport system component